MYFDEMDLRRIRGRLADRLSELLFEGRIEYAESGDEAALGRALGAYFRSAPPEVRADSPELFRLMDAAFESGFSGGGAALPPRQRRFFTGLGAAPEPFTDICGCYFAGGIISLPPMGVFVDGGALDLFNSFRFARKSRNGYSAIYAFEPDAHSFAECSGNAALFGGRLHLFNLALGDRAARAPFLSAGPDSRLDAAGDRLVPSDTLDRCLGGVQPSLVKLHLEGAEEAALRGAERTIRAGAPQIAVCLDHRPGDVAAIPRLLLEFFPGYRLYLRHYSSSITETVLYAVK